MLIVICGKSGAGKSEASSYIIENYDIEKVKTTTTRPKRKDNPNDEIDYNFVSDLGFFDMEDDLTLIKCYNTVHGKWWYGVQKSDFDDIEEKDKIILLDPKGVEELQEILPKNNYVVIEICCWSEIRKQRTLARNDNRAEVERRLIADEEDFKNLVADIHISNETNDINILYDSIDLVLEKKIGIRKVADCIE